MRFGVVRQAKVNVSGASRFVRVQVSQSDMYDYRCGEAGCGLVS